jgi:hypothetical protein
MQKETRLFLRLALLGVGIIAIVLALYGNAKEDATALAWFVFP